MVKLLIRALGERVSRLVWRRLEHSAGDPAMTLIVVGISAFEIREAAVLRLEGGLQIGAIVDGMRPGIA